jgi:hypothetical protein
VIGIAKRKNKEEWRDFRFSRKAEDRRMLWEREREEEEEAEERSKATEN